MGSYDFGIYRFQKIHKDKGGAMHTWVHWQLPDGTKTKTKLGFRFFPKKLVRLSGLEIPPKDWKRVSDTLWQMKRDMENDQPPLL